MGNENAPSGAQTEALPTASIVEGIDGMDKLEITDALKSGEFAKYIKEVLQMRSNREELFKKLQAIDHSTKLTGKEKKYKFHHIGSKILMAALAENITFEGEKAFIVLNFRDLNFARRWGVGAGDILPTCIRKVTFFKEKGPIEGVREGRGYYYTNEKGKKKYIAIKNQKLMFEYKNVITDPKAAALAKAEDKKVDDKHEAKISTEEKTAELKKAISPEMAKKLPAPPPSLENQETPRPVTKLAVIGDSQVEGLSGRLAKEGIPYSDLRGFSIRGITNALNNPASIRTNIKIKNEDPVKQAQYEKRMQSEAARTEKAVAALTSAERVFVQCGGNNIHDKNQTVEMMKRDFTALIETIKRKFPRKNEIYVGYLMPSSVAQVGIEGAKRAEFNLWLHQEAQAGKFKLIDTYRNVVDKDNPSLRNEKLFQGPKNPHLKGKYYTKLADEILKALNYQPNAKK